MSTKKVQILDSLVAPSDWNSTEGSTQILNKPTKLSQFEGEMTTDEQAAVREKIGFVQPNCEQNDNTQPDYIKNRTHYKEVIHQEEVELLPATEIDFSSFVETGCYSQTEPLSIKAGDTVKVLWDNALYEGVAKLGAEYGLYSKTGLPDDTIIFGNLSAFDIDDPETNEIPFAVVSNYTFGGEGVFVSGCIITPTTEVSNPITVKIFTGGDKVVYHKLDVNYLPISESDISSDNNNIVTSKPLINYLRVNRPDYEVSDSDDPRFIKNRPCYRSLWGSTGYLFSRTITLNENGLYTSSDKLFSFDDIYDNSYGDINLTVYWHDGTYNCKLRKLYTDWVDEFGDYQGRNYFVFGNVSDIEYNYSDDTAPFLIYADYNPDTRENNATYIKAYDGFTGEITLQVDAEYRYWGYILLDNRYLNVDSLRADWDEESNSKASFIVNKPCYRYKVSGDNHSPIADSFVLSSDGTCTLLEAYLNLNEKLNNDEPVNNSNITINVKWNNEEYNCKIRLLLDEYTNDSGDNIAHHYYVFGNVSSIDGSYSDTAPFLIYANYNPETHEYGETYIVSQDGSTGEVSCEFKYSYEYWGYNKLNNKYLNLSTNVYQGNNNPVTSDAVYEAIASKVSGHTHNTATISTDGFMSSSDKAKLDTVAEYANAYTHPDTHPASMIEEDASHRFVSDAEKAAWNNKSNSDHNHDSDYLKLSGGTLTGDLVLNGDPTSDNVVANKKYVDDAIALAIGTALGGSY